jgi:hypothetical protein
MIGWSVTSALCIWWLVGWHRKQRAANKPGMASLPFIVLCFLIAIIAVGGAAYGLGMRTSAQAIPLEKASEPAAKAITGKPQPEYLRNIQFSWDSQLPLGVSFVPTTTTDRLRFYVDASPRMLGVPSHDKPTYRAQIGELKDIVKGQRRDTQLIFRGPKHDGGDLYWGSPTNNYPVTDINRVRFVTIGPDGSEQHFYFLMVYTNQIIQILLVSDS